MSVLHGFAMVPALEQGLGEYVDFYLHERPHLGLEFSTPAKVYGRRRKRRKAFCRAKKVWLRQASHAFLALLTNCHQLLRPRETWMGKGFAGCLASLTLAVELSPLSWVRTDLGQNTKLIVPLASGAVILQAAAGLALLAIADPRETNTDIFYDPESDDGVCCGSQATERT